MAGKLLANKVAVVTASTEGIGLAIAQRLLRDGAKVMIGSRKAANVEKALAELSSSSTGNEANVSGAVCHVGDAKQRANFIQQAVDKFGKIDILVSNAAANPHFGRSLDISEDSWDKIFDTNVKAGFFLVKDAYPHFAKNASIIFVTSIAAYVPFPIIGPYSISKTALLGVVKTLAGELGPEGIRVNGIAPGVIRTKFSQALTSNDKIAKGMMGTTALKRLGEVEDCVGAVSFLASDQSSYITGEIINITGGMTARL